MTTKAMTQTVRNWREMVAMVKADENATDYEVRCAAAVEMAINAAVATINLKSPHARCTVEDLPFNLPGQRLTIDLPVA